MSKRTFLPPLPSQDFCPADHQATDARMRALIDGVTDPALRARLMAEHTKPAELAKRTKDRFDNRRHRRSLLGQRGGFSERSNG